MDLTRTCSNLRGLLGHDDALWVLWLTHPDTIATKNAKSTIFQFELGRFGVGVRARSRSTNPRRRND